MLVIATNLGTGSIRITERKLGQNQGRGQENDRHTEGALHGHLREPGLLTTEVEVAAPDRGRPHPTILVEGRVRRSTAVVHNMEAVEVQNLGIRNTEVITELPDQDHEKGVILPSLLVAIVILITLTIGR